MAKSIVSRFGEDSGCCGETRICGKKCESIGEDNRVKRVNGTIGRMNEQDAKEMK
jgi:hypothetical protein